MDRTALNPKQKEGPGRGRESRPAGPLRRTGRFILGWFFIVLGVAGLFLPVLQGVLFLGLGLALLARDSPWARKILECLKKRYPRQYGKIEKFRERAGQWWKNLCRRR